MNSRPNLIPLLAVAALLWWAFSGTSADPDTAAQSAARQAVQQFARDLSRLADEAGDMEPDAAAAHIKSRVQDEWREACQPINDLIDQSVKDGKFREVMAGVSAGYAEASK